MCAFVHNISIALSNVDAQPAAVTPLSPKRVAHIAQNSVERAKLLVDSVSRESVGSAETNPISAGLNLTCDVGEALLHGLPNHAHWHHVCAGALHIVSDILTACPN